MNNLPIDAIVACDAEVERLRARVAELEAAAAHLACAWTAQHVINTDLDRRVVNMIMVWDRPRFEAAIAESARAANGENTNE